MAASPSIKIHKLNGAVPTGGGYPAAQNLTTTWHHNQYAGAQVAGQLRGQNVYNIAAVASNGNTFSLTVGPSKVLLPAIIS